MFMHILMYSLVAISANRAYAFPSHRSLAGFTEQQLEDIIPTLKYQHPEPPPGPLEDTSAKLVSDEDHPWKPLKEGDMRGPCPGLNTLASHGWLPRNGVATPAQIINAVQEGFNMENSLAILVTYAAFLVDGNPITNLLSIGGKSSSTGPDPPSPAIVGGLSTHGPFEGDASMTREDDFFGNNHDFNETLFDELVAFSNKFGDGKYNLTVASEFRFQRIKNSIATNPNFSFTSPRIFTAYAESVFPINFFIDGRQTDGQLDMEAARGFLGNMRMPDGFFRPNGSRGAEGMDVIFRSHPMKAGANVNGTNTYTIDPTSANIGQFCLMYENFVKQTIKGLYPSPSGILLRSLNTNLNFFYQSIRDDSGPFCKQVFPYGRSN